MLTWDRFILALRSRHGPMQVSQEFYLLVQSRQSLSLVGQVPMFKSELPTAASWPPLECGPVHDSLWVCRW